MSDTPKKMEAFCTKCGGTAVSHDKERDGDHPGVGRCETCGMTFIDDRQADTGLDLCAVCFKPLRVGDQGCIVTIRPHEPTLTYYPFIPYFDFALGEEVTSLGERWTKMKKQEDGEGLVIRERLEYRDKMSKGDLSARRDRMQEKRREEVRQGIRSARDL